MESLSGSFAGIGVYATLDRVANTITVSVSVKKPNFLFLLYLYKIEQISKLKFYHMPY